MPNPPINIGDAIKAGWLNRINDVTNRLQGLGVDGAPGAGLRVGAKRGQGFMGAVTARDIPAGAGPFYLHQMSYEITCPPLKNDGPLVADWTRRIVDIPAPLNGPDADPGMLYYPAAVIGTAEQTLAPWRGYCWVYVMPGIGDADGAPVWFVDLWGENPAWGCAE
jgi:hypothetical protein